MNSSVICEICLASTALVRDEIRLGNFSIAVASAAVQTLCAMLAGKIVNGECKFLTSSIKNIATMIADGFNNTEICADLKLCD